MAEHTGEAFPDGLAPGDVLCDCRRNEWFEVRRLDDDRIELRQADQEFYAPHSLLAAWYGSRLFSIEHTASLTPPRWLAE